MEEMHQMRSDLLIQHIIDKYHRSSREEALKQTTTIKEQTSKTTQQEETKQTDQDVDVDAKEADVNVDAEEEEETKETVQDVDVDAKEADVNVDAEEEEDGRGISKDLLDRIKRTRQMHYRKRKRAGKHGNWLEEQQAKRPRVVFRW
eukprot:791510_1